MNNKNQNTDEILSAIRDMMSDEETSNEQPLPKDVLELTQSVEPNKNPMKNEDVLELTKLVSANDPIVHLENIDNKNISFENREQWQGAANRHSDLLQSLKYGCCQI